MDTTNKIQFEKPDITALTRDHTVVDLHFHTRYSDGVNPVKAIAKQSEALGIGIAITDHNEIRGAVEIDKYKRILSIPGIEITSREGTHLLVYFYDTRSLKAFYREDLKPYMGNDIMSSTLLEMEELIRRARNYRTVIIFPHPYCAAYTGIYNLQFPKDRLDRLFQMVDGVEVLNAGNLNKWNLQCAVLGFNLDKSITGGSDGHSLTHMGRAVTYADCKKTRKAFLDAVRKKKTKVIGKEIDFIRKVTANSRKLKKNFKNYPNLVEKNLRYGYTIINSKSRTLRKNVLRSINDRLEKAS